MTFRSIASRARGPTGRRAAGREGKGILPVAPARRGRAGVVGLGALAALAVGFFLLPVLALVLRAPWGSLGTVARAPVVTEALRLSVVTATMATLLAAVFGIPLAWLLARVPLPGRRLIRALVTAPMVLPPVVAGVGLALALGRRGLLGSPLAGAGITFPFTTWGAVVAEAFVAAPFLVVAVEAGLLGVDPRFEAAAATLGATPLTVLRRVTLRMAGPSVLAGLALCWARALGEFGATITFAGNLPRHTQTMPLAVYLARETDPDAANLMALILLALSLAVIIALRGRLQAARPP